MLRENQAYKSELYNAGKTKTSLSYFYSSGLGGQPVNPAVYYNFIKPQWYHFIPQRF